jgi:predicted nucleotidyltransferase
MMECKHVPEVLKAHLSDLKQMRKEQTSRLKNGSQKAFFHRVWNRLHEAEEKELQAQAACAAEQETRDASAEAASPSPVHYEEGPTDGDTISV